MTPADEDHDMLVALAGGEQKARQLKRRTTATKPKAKPTLSPSDRLRDLSYLMSASPGGRGQRARF